MPRNISFTDNIMLKTLSIEPACSLYWPLMTLLLLIVGFTHRRQPKFTASLQRINHLQGEQMGQLNAGYTLILRARNEAGQAVRMMEVGLLDMFGDGAVKTINRSGAGRKR